MSSEICKNCDRIIGNLERAFVFNGNIVCSGCYNTLSAAEDKQGIPAIKKSLQIKCLWIGIGAIILLCLFPPWEVYLYSEYESSSRSYEHHWCNSDEHKILQYSLAYSGLFKHPSLVSGRATIDYVRLIVECTIVAIVTGGLFVTIGRLQQKQAKSLNLALTLKLKWLMLPLARMRKIPCRIVCKTHMVALTQRMLLYAGDNVRDMYPTADHWCDSLIKYDRKLSHEKFRCKGDKKGPSSYAMNKNIEKLGINSPPDMVLLFESKPGWNQSGGPELLTTENHNGEGCNISFCDGQVAFVRTEDINNLRWTAES